jgi:hypothetical protein
MNPLDPMSAPSLEERLAALPISVKQERKKSRCPNCRKHGGVRVNSTIRTPTGRYRWRQCLLCDHLFETEMNLPLHCSQCNHYNDFRVGTTRNIRNGVLRFYQCKNCGTHTPAFEYFPIPEDKKKRPNINQDY